MNPRCLYDHALSIISIYLLFAGAFNVALTLLGFFLWLCFFTDAINAHSLGVNRILLCIFFSEKITQSKFAVCCFSIMVVIKMPLDCMLDCVLHELGLPEAKFDMQHHVDGTYWSTVYYPYIDSNGNQVVSFMVGISIASEEDARNGAVQAVLDHLKALYNLEIVDYNYRDMLLFKMHCENYEKQELGVLKAAYEKLSAQFFSLKKKYEKVSKIMKRIKSNVDGINYLL